MTFFMYHCWSKTPPKKQVKTAIKVDTGNNKEYDVKTICDSKIYSKKSDNGHYLSGLYYLVL